MIGGAAIRCPRCRREAPAPAPFCAGCGAPLVLGDEPVRPLDATLEPPGPPPGAAASPLRSELALDRRSRRPPPPLPANVARNPVAAIPAPAPAAKPPDPGPAAAEPAGDLPSSSPGEARPERGCHGEGALERSHWDLGRAGEAPAPTDDPVPDADVDALEVHLERAEPWRRAAAWAVDALPFAAAGLFLAGGLVEGIAGGAGPDELLDLIARERVIVLSVAGAVTLALAVYATVAHALAGATLGKRLFRLRVVGPDGGRPSPGRSAARSALAVASAAALGLGLLLALFTRSGRALHDLIARTWVVKAP